MLHEDRPHTSNASIVGDHAESQNEQRKINLSVSQYTFDFDDTLASRMFGPMRKSSYSRDAIFIPHVTAGYRD